MQDSYDVNLKCEFEFKGPGLRAQGPCSKFGSKRLLKCFVLVHGLLVFQLTAHSGKGPRAQGSEQPWLRAQGSICMGLHYMVMNSLKQNNGVFFGSVCQRAYCHCFSFQMQDSQTRCDG